jgi:hypothetical protein
VYKLNNTAVTELNLLGNAGLIRLIGDLYGIILLPESATGKDIEEARKLLIDRGAADAAGGSSFYGAWYERRDMVTFKNSSFPDTTNFAYSWENCVNLSNLETLHAPSGTSFVGAWRGTTALTSFPEGAKLGTEASNVDFESAWQSSGLTSFPALDLSTGNNFFNAFRGTQLTTIDSGVLLGTAVASANVNFQNAFRETPLTAFSALDLSKGKYFTSTWQGTTALTSFPADAKLGTAAASVNFTSAWQSSGLTSFSTPLPTATTLTQSFQACSSLTQFISNLSSALTLVRTWRNSGLTSFSVELPSARFISQAWDGCSDLVDFSANVFANWNPSSINSGVFSLTWNGCTSLTSQSVENILVSIDASGKYATSTGASGGTALADAGIDIDYNGDPLTAATTAAIDSLSGKGWQVYINGELVIPNILDLQPAAAYSLRSFDADADPVVVNVRRSSDSATSDFKASEVSDGTLTSWVNTEYETVTNGEFATDSVWVKGSGWGIANGKATSDGTQTGTSYLYQLASMGASQSQRVTLVVSGYVAGTVKVRLGDSAPASSVTPDLSSNGTYVFTLPSHSTTPYLFLQASSDFQGSIESISVVQLTSDGHVTTWYDQSGNNNSSNQPLASSQPKIVDGGTLVTENGLPSINFHTEVSNLSLDHSDLYGQATLDSYYVTNTTDTQYLYPACGSGSRYGMVAESGSSLTILSEIYGNPSFYANGSQITGGTRDAIYTATSGGQKLVAHQGADTTDLSWASSMNFGNYQNLTDYSYTGKLQEMIFFNTDQSANRTGIENNINDHFDIYS